MGAPDREWARRRLQAKKDEQKADDRDPDTIRQIQQEAKAAGATLASGGRGGLDPKVALKAFRRGKWTCAVPDCKTPKNKLDLDHPSGHQREISRDPEARQNKQLRASAALGHSETDARALRVVCERHHSEFHDRERAIERGDKPAPVDR